jgi:predicted lipoprotein with Yx(FWY)xxD motif
MLSISVPTSVASGVYPVTVTGSSASFYHSVTLALNVAVSTMPSSMNSVNIANKPGIGSYLTNATGWTLYTFARDIPTNGTSRCTGNYCVKNWPVFYAANLTLSQRLNATSFTVITRPDGGKQIAYNGWPLYYFRNDTTPGDTKGQGFAKAWSVCTFPTPFTIITSTTTTSAVTAAEREGY